MIKVNYEFTALQPIHTGSDENTGTERKLRREKVLLREPKVYNSNFQNIEEKREAAIAILFHIFKCIDFDGMQKSRLIGIWEEFTSKVLASTSVRTKENFLNIISAKLGIRTLANDFSEKIILLLNKFNDDEFLSLIRDDLQYLILRLRIEIKDKKENKQNNISLFEEKKQKIDI